MKLYKIKDTFAIFWFFILIILQYNKKYNVVIILLTIGMLADLLVTVTDIGELNIVFLNKKVSLTILLSNNKKIKRLNKDFRNKNKSTDILFKPKVSLNQNFDFLEKV